MTLPGLPRTILTDDEARLYAAIGKRARRRRAIGRAVYWATYGVSAAAVSLVLAVVAVAR